MSPFLPVMIFSWTIGGILFVRGQDISGCLERIDGYKESAFGNRVFYISTEKQSWGGAETRCEGLGGHLAVLSNETALKHVREFLKALDQAKGESFWIGLRWDSTAECYKWLSGETNQHEGNDDWLGRNDDEYGKFVAMVPPGFLFNNNVRFNLFNNFYFVCEKERTVWHIGRHGDKDFYVVNRARTWSDGKRVCEACNGAHLAEIRDKETQRFLQTSLTSANPNPLFQLYWMGLRVNQSSPDNLSLAWSTGEKEKCGPSSNSYSCRMIKKNSSEILESICVGLNISTSTFQWESEDCSSKAGFLCEKGIPRPETTTPEDVTSPTTAEVTSSTAEEATSTETDAAGTSSAIPVSATSTMATTREGVTGETNNSQGTESSASYLTQIVVPCIVGVAFIVLAAALLTWYCKKKRRQTRSMKDAELVSITRQGLPGTEMRFDNSTYGEHLPLFTDNAHGLEATGGVAAALGGPLQERGERGGSSVPDAETYDHAFQSRPVAREATGNIYGHPQDANATETETETYDHVFNTKTTSLQSGGGSDCYGHLTLEGKTDSDDPYDSTAQARSREATVDCTAYDHLPVENSGVTSPDSPDSTEPMYINK